MPPGSLVHIGERKAETVTITLVQYDEQHLDERQLRSAAELGALPAAPTVTWLSVDGLHDPGVLEGVGDRFGLHPLTLEDILNTEQRPKLDVFDSYVFIVLKALSFAEESSQVQVDQVSIVLGDNFVLSFQEREINVLKPLRQRMENGRSQLRRAGPDYLAYALIDSIVDSYFSVLERLGDKIEVLEEALVANPEPGILQQVQRIRTEMLLVRKAVWPLREVVAEMERRDTPLIRATTKVFLRDVYDHVIQMMDTVETLREVASGMLDIYLSSISNKTNEITKVLTIIATIFIPLTFIAGVYGMNFEHMPELESPWGYPAILTLMALVVIGMVIYFRRQRWI